MACSIGTSMNSVTPLKILKNWLPFEKRRKPRSEMPFKLLSDVFGQAFLPEDFFKAPPRPVGYPHKTGNSKRERWKAEKKAKNWERVHSPSPLLPSFLGTLGISGTWRYFFMSASISMSFLPGFIESMYSFVSSSAASLSMPASTRFL